MTKLNEKIYDKLEPLERAKLAIAALSRNDEEEVKRLSRTCPRYTYVGTDINYTSHMYCMTWIKIHFNWLSESYCSKLELLQSYINFTELFLETTSFTKEERLQKTKMFAIEQLSHISSLKSLYKGFTEFCDEVELNKDQLICWFETEKMHENIKNYLSNDIVNNAELTEHYKTQFKTLWEIRY